MFVLFPGLYDDNGGGSGHGREEETQQNNAVSFILENHISFLIKFYIIIYRVLILI